MEKVYTGRKGCDKNLFSDKANGANRGTSGVWIIESSETHILTEWKSDVKYNEKNVEKTIVFHFFIRKYFY